MNNVISADQNFTYWGYEAGEHLRLPLVVPLPDQLTPNAQRFIHEETSNYLSAAALSHSDNHTQSDTPLLESTLSYPTLYTSFNISEDIIDYINGFLDESTKEKNALGSTIAQLLPNVSSNLTGTRPPDLSEFLETLPKDRVSLLSFLFLFSFATVFGNTLVILAVIRERYLHTATNYFITSLAVADCLVGLVVMPFSALYEVLDNTWFFGTDWCDFWRSLDVLFSTASILNLCVISLDRYWAITDPFSYPMRMTVKRAALLICAVWICSSAISFPAIVWWRAARDGEMPAYKCTFTEHLGYLVFSSTISFYLPLLVMVFTYCRIYRAAVIQTRSLKIGTKQVLMSSGELQLTLRIHRGGTTRDPTTSSHHQTHHGSIGGGGGGGVGGVPTAHHASHHQHHHHHHSQHNHNTTGGGTTTSTPEEPDDEPLSALHNNGLSRHRHMGKNFSLSRKLAKFAKEKKAAKTLGIVMGVFIVCWLPFFVVNLLSGFCMKCIEHEEVVLAIVTWLGWINSCMNPVIYACWSRDFRRAFVRLLCVCCPRKIRRKYQPTMRSKSQLSSCSSCSGSSNCGRNNVHQHCHHSQHKHHNHQQNTHNNMQHLQLQQQSQQREPNCSRCQSFHRHHHRQRRRSSTLLEYPVTNSTSPTNTTRVLVNTIPKNSISTPTTTMSAGNMGSTITIASVPSSLMLGMGYDNARKANITRMGSLSAAATPLAPSTGKHCSFALTPIIIPPPNNKVSFLSKARKQSNLSTVPLTMPSTTEISESALVEEDYDELNILTSTHLNINTTAEQRQSIQSQITSVDDVDTDENGLLEIRLDKEHQ